ncbi:MAG: hypothetical protein EOM43_00260 [Gammaproteobacteria bacterium]|nr:hypothetical protein [Gammaproteobacteria bacterium]
MHDFALVFRHAWELAKKGAATYGGSARQYFRESLKLSYENFKRNVTSRDLVKIMLGRKMSMGEIREEVNAKFQRQTAKNIARRIWNMFRSTYVEIEKIKVATSKNFIYHLKKVDKKFFSPSAITRALKMPVKPKWVKPRPAMADEEINACRLANAFHNALRTGVYIAPTLI